jgi:hypothetical protein
MPDRATPTAEAPKRRRGGQPGNLNALKYGEHSPRLRNDFSAFPRQTRLLIAAAIWVAYKHELQALPPPRSAEARRKAHRAALIQLRDCFQTLDLTRNLTHLDVLRSLRPMFEHELAAYEARRELRLKWARAAPG